MVSKQTNLKDTKKKALGTNARQKKSKKAKTTRKKPPVKKKVAPEVSFYLANGTVCSDLTSLAKTIDEIKDDIFEHHVNDDKNDFASWIEDVFEHKPLASKLKKTKNKDRHVIEIYKAVIHR